MGRYKLFFITALIISIGALGVVYFVGRTPATNENANAAANTNVTTNADTNTPGSAGNTSTTARNPDEVAVRNVAATFAERYGSYSNQNSNQNLVDASSLMTAQYRQTTLATISAASPTTAEEYSGTSSRAVAVSIGTLQAQLRASVIVTLNRQPTGSDGRELPTYTQRLSLGMRYEQGAWLVDSAVWLERGS